MKKNGFTLIEILVLIGVVAILFSFALPSLRGFSSRLSLNASAKTIASELRTLKARAVSEHQTLSFDPAKTKLPSAVKYKKVSKIAFSPSGSTPPGGSGTIILENRFGQYKKIIVSTSGRVRIE